MKITSSVNISRAAGALFLLFAAMIGVAGAQTFEEQRDLQNRLHGKWEIAWDATAENARGRQRTDVQKLKKLGIHIVLTFREGGRSTAVTTFGGAEERKESTWKVMDTQNVVLVVQTTENAMQKRNTLYIRFLDEGRFSDPPAETRSTDESEPSFGGFPAGEKMLVSSADRPANERPGQGPPLIFQRVVEEKTIGVEKPATIK